MESASKGKKHPHQKFIDKLNALREIKGQTDEELVTFENVHAYQSYEDPTRPELKIHSFLVNLKDYPLNLVNDAKHNCRTEGLKLKKPHMELKEKVARKKKPVAEGKKPVTDTHLSLNHSGITNSTDGTVTERANKVTVMGKTYIRNGGHSNRIFQELAVEDNLPTDQYVKVEIVEGKLSRQQSVEFSIGRNTGESLKVHSHLNLAGKTKWVQDILDKTPFGQRIAYEEGQHDRFHPIHFPQLVQLMDMTNIAKHPAGKYPSDSQLHPNKLLRSYVENVESFQAMKDVLTDVLMVHDGLEEIIIESLQSKIGDSFKEALSQNKKGESKRPSKFSKYKVFASTKKRGIFTSPYTDKEMAASVNGGAIAPILSAVRAFQQVRSGNVVWKGGVTVPLMLSVYRQAISTIIDDIIDNKGINAPEDIAENSEVWKTVYRTVELAYARHK